ncbi:hypothetical protein D3C86_1728210 [compost metagenome]
MSVVTTFKLDDFFSSSKSSCQTNCAHTSFSSRRNHSYLVDIRDVFYDVFRNFGFQFCWRSERKTFLRLRFQSFQNFGMCVSQNRWSPRIDVIDVVSVVLICEVSTFRRLHKKWNTAHRFKSTNRRIHTARNIFVRFFKKR